MEPPSISHIEPLKTKPEKDASPQRHRGTEVFVVIPAQAGIHVIGTVFLRVSVPLWLGNLSFRILHFGNESYVA